MDKQFIDKTPGKDTLRPQLDAMPSFAREGDTVVVHSMDRLARNLDELRRLVQQLPKRGIRIEFAMECLSCTGEDAPLANLLLSVMGAFAEIERALIRERQNPHEARIRQIARGKFLAGAARPSSWCRRTAAASPPPVDLSDLIDGHASWGARPPPLSARYVNDNTSTYLSGKYSLRQLRQARHRFDRRHARQFVHIQVAPFSCNSRRSTKALAPSSRK